MAITAYTATKRREVEAARAQLVEDRDRGHAAGSLEDYLAWHKENTAWPTSQEADRVEFATARHAELVARFAA